MTLQSLYRLCFVNNPKLLDYALQIANYVGKKSLDGFEESWFNLTYFNLGISTPNLFAVVEKQDVHCSLKSSLSWNNFEVFESSEEVAFLLLRELIRRFKSTFFEVAKIADSLYSELPMVTVFSDRSIECSAGWVYQAEKDPVFTIKSFPLMVEIVFYSAAEEAADRIFTKKTIDKIKKMIAVG